MVLFPSSLLPLQFIWWNFQPACLFLLASFLTSNSLYSQFCFDFFEKLFDQFFYWTRFSDWNDLDASQLALEKSCFEPKVACLIFFCSRRRRICKSCSEGMVNSERKNWVSFSCCNWPLRWIAMLSFNRTLDTLLWVWSLEVWPFLK